jgi:hypothetical protein
MKFLGENNLMLDLETMSTASNAAIVSIGAVIFSSTGTRETFYTNVYLQSCIDYKLNVDASTIYWWLGQSKKVRSGILSQGRDILDALECLRKFIKDNDHIGLGKQAVWANGADFDLPIIHNAYRAVGVECPFSFRQHRCYRTIYNCFNLGGVKNDLEIDHSGKEHNALSDAIYQANILIEGNKLL